jgi:hypothetical protein
MPPWPAFSLVSQSGIPQETANPPLPSQPSTGENLLDTLLGHRGEERDSECGLRAFFFFVSCLRTGSVSFTVSREFADPRKRATDMASTKRNGVKPTISWQLYELRASQGLRKNCCGTSLCSMHLKSVTGAGTPQKELSKAANGQTTGADPKSNNGGRACTVITITSGRKYCLAKKIQSRTTGRSKHT